MIRIYGNKDSVEAAFQTLIYSKNKLKTIQMLNRNKVHGVFTSGYSEYFTRINSNTILYGPSFTQRYGDTIKFEKDSIYIYPDILTVTSHRKYAMPKIWNYKSEYHGYKLITVENVRLGNIKYRNCLKMSIRLNDSANATIWINNNHGHIKTVYETNGLYFLTFLSNEILDSTEWKTLRSPGWL